MRNLLIVLLGLIVHALGAQQDTTIQERVETVVVSSLRIPSASWTTPLSISDIDLKPTRSIRQQLSLQEYLTESPGLFILNANNYAQDLRISSRGFGARAAFGIRGIKLVVDGIPETTPDGQGQIDNLSLDIIDRIEVLRGPSSSLYGNASGGVISITTLEQFDYDFINTGITFGAYGMQQYTATVGKNIGDTKLILKAGHTSTSGYRDQSGFKNTNLNAKIIHNFKKDAQLKVLANYTNSPVADDPGGINIQSVQSNRKQARDRNVLFKTGEKIQHSKLGAHYTQKINEKFDLATYAFYSARKFEGLLPFEFGGAVNLDRAYYGLGLNINHKVIRNQGVYNSKMGIDLLSQNDLRTRFKNVEGTLGDKTLEQKETFSNAAVYWLGDYSVNRWVSSVGIRLDFNSLMAKDKFLTNGDDSGERRLFSFSYSFGLGYRISSEFSLYANYRKSFETPSLSELSANPTGAAGFNDSLKEQSASNIELGLKGTINNQLKLNVVGFLINTKNDLVSFELEQFPDRNFFRNAGSTNRIGLEILGQYQLTKSFGIKASYTYSDFSYGDYVVNDSDLSDNQLPGIPKHFGNIILEYINKDMTALITYKSIGALYTNDANNVQDAAYSLVNLNIGYNLKLNNFKIQPFIGLNNLFNTLYNDNIRLNAFGARYYEPAPERHIFGGLKIRIGQSD